MLKQSQLERVFETPAGKAGLGETSRRKPRRLPDRTRKASAWSDLTFKL